MLNEEDDGTIVENVRALESLLIGQRIVKLETTTNGITELTLSNDTVVELHDTSDCCAYTTLREVITHLPTAEHVITGMKTNEYYTEWFVLCDFGEIMRLEVDWSCGNPFYYSYGLWIRVRN